jgi:hypothetical protein
MSKDSRDLGFQHPQRCERPLRPRPFVLAQLITTSALVLSIAVAATAVSIGIARAEGLARAADSQSAHAVALVVALLLAGMGGITALVTRSHPSE